MNLTKAILEQAGFTKTFEHLYCLGDVNVYCEDRLYVNTAGRNFSVEVYNSDSTQRGCLDFNTVEDLITMLQLCGKTAEADKFKKILTA